MYGKVIDKTSTFYNQVGRVSHEDESYLRVMIAGTPFRFPKKSIELQEQPVHQEDIPVQISIQFPDHSERTYTVYGQDAKSYLIENGRRIPKWLVGLRVGQLYEQGSEIFEVEKFDQHSINGNRFNNHDIKLLPIQIGDMVLAYNKNGIVSGVKNHKIMVKHDFGSEDTKGYWMTEITKEPAKVISFPDPGSSVLVNLQGHEYHGQVLRVVKHVGHNVLISKGRYGLDECLIAPQYLQPLPYKISDLIYTGDQYGIVIRVHPLSLDVKTASGMIACLHKDVKIVERYAIGTTFRRFDEVWTIARYSGVYYVAENAKGLCQDFLHNDVLPAPSKSTTSGEGVNVQNMPKMQFTGVKEQLGANGLTFGQTMAKAGMDYFAKGAFPSQALQSETQDAVKERAAKWDNRFLALAEHIASWSKDPSTKVGAVIVDNDRRVVSTGYNGFARGVEDTDERLNNRETKYKLVVHAERNAILFATQTKDCTLYTWPFMPCSTCASMIIQSGIKRVVAPEASAELKERWGPDMELSMQQFKEAGVEVLLVPEHKTTFQPKEVEISGTWSPVNPSKEIPPVVEEEQIKKIRTEMELELQLPDVNMFKVSKCVAAIRKLTRDLRKRQIPADRLKRWEALPSKRLEEVSRQILAGYRQTEDPVRRQKLLDKIEEIDLVLPDQSWLSYFLSAMTRTGKLNFADLYGKSLKDQAIEALVPLFLLSHGDETVVYESPYAKVASIFKKMPSLEEKLKDLPKYDPAYYQWIEKAGLPHSDDLLLAFNAGSLGKLYYQDMLFKIARTLNRIYDHGLIVGNWMHPSNDLLEKIQLLAHPTTLAADTLHPSWVKYSEACRKQNMEPTSRATWLLFLIAAKYSHPTLGGWAGEHPLYQSFVAECKRFGKALTVSPELFSVFLEGVGS